MAVEPWLRGTHADVDAVRRQVVHALEQAREDVDAWCCALTDEQVNARPAQIGSVAFQLRHIARSLGRLIAYARGQALTSSQLALLASEEEPGAIAADVVAEAQAALGQAIVFVLQLDPARYEQPRKVGRQGLPTTVGGLMVHLAEHTQRHIGELILTVRIVRAQMR